MDRNKTLEEAKKNEIFNQYFPNNPEQSVPQRSGHPSHTHDHHTCCNQPPASRQCMHSVASCSCALFRCHGHDHDRPGDNNSNTLDIISTSVSNLGNEVQSLKQLLNSLLSSHVTPQPSTLNITKPSDLTHVQDKQAPTMAITSPNQVSGSESPVSLDGFTFDEDSTVMDLN